MRVRSLAAVAAFLSLGTLALVPAGSRQVALERGGGFPAPPVEAAGDSSDDESDDKPKKKPTPCQQVAKIATQACKSEAEDDYLTHVGNCLYLGSYGEIGACYQDAKAERKETLTLCQDRLDARFDVCDLLGEKRYEPQIDPEDFLSPAEVAADPNPYFPLVPGNTWVYEDEQETITVTVTGETIEILGVDCIVVRDIVTAKDSGDTVEDTVDWYAQDGDGNLWYFGEIAQNFDDGLLADLDGSWMAGRDFAKPGIVFPADPYPGQAYRQEYSLGEAEDIAEVVSIDADESTDAADCAGQCLQTLETTPISPDAAEYKYYVPGLGLILEVNPHTGDRTELVSFTEGP